MGDIADAIIEGLMDSVTCEYIGHKNIVKYGSEAPGFPVTYENPSHNDRIAKELDDYLTSVLEDPVWSCPNCGFKLIQDFCEAVEMAGGHITERMQKAIPGIHWCDVMVLCDVFIDDPCQCSMEQKCTSVEC